MRFESSGWAEYSIEDFATSMDATEKQRSDFHDIKRRIIEPAVKEAKKRIEMGRKIKNAPIQIGETQYQAVERERREYVQARAQA